MERYEYEIRDPQYPATEELLEEAAQLPFHNGARQLVPGYWNTGVYLDHCALTQALRHGPAGVPSVAPLHSVKTQLTDGMICKGLCSPIVKVRMIL